MSGLTSVPVLKQAVDVLRDGPHSVLSRQAVVHPVQHIQQHAASMHDRHNKAMLSRIYGSSLPMKLTMEERIVSQHQRIPGLHSSRIGLEILMGVDDDIEFGNYLNLPENNPMLKFNPHEAMENKGKTKKSK